MLDNASPIWTVLIIGSIAFVVALVGVPTVRRLAMRTGVLDNPQQGKMHTGATPYFGGLAIGFATLLIPSLFQSWTREAAYIGIAAIMVSLCGLVDDLRNLNPYARLGVEMLAAALAVHAGARINLFDNWLDVVLTVGWLVVITNSFNLLDNMDGVAGHGRHGHCARVGRRRSPAGTGPRWSPGRRTLAGGCLGFLVYNWHPASIFMGDAGSLLLGFLLAVVSLKLRWSTPHFESVTAVILDDGAGSLRHSARRRVAQTRRSFDHGGWNRSHESPPPPARPSHSLGGGLPRSRRNRLRVAGCAGRSWGRAPVGGDHPAAHAQRCNFHSARADACLHDRSGRVTGEGGAGASATWPAACRTTRCSPTPASAHRTRLRTLGGRHAHPLSFGLVAEQSPDGADHGIPSRSRRAPSHRGRPPA